MIKRIIMIGDALRPCPSQWGNINAYYWLLKGYIPNLEVYSTDGIPSTLEDWMQSFREDHNKSWIETQTYINENTLLIALETPLGELARFRKLGVPYIYLSWHNLTGLYNPDISLFLNLQRDILYAVSTHGVNINFPQYSKEQQKIDSYRNRAEYCYKGRIPCPENTAVIYGQNVVEFCHISKDFKRFLKLQDFEKEIKEIISTHTQTIFKVHPHDPDEIEQKEYMKSLGCVLPDNYVIKYNAYDYMCEPKIKDIYSTVGSVIEEAEFFDVTAKHLYRDVIDRIPKSIPVSEYDLLNTLKEYFKEEIK